MAPGRVFAPGPDRPRGGQCGGRCACQHPRVRNRRPIGLTRPAGVVAALLLLAGCASQAGTDEAASTGGATSGSAAAEEATGLSSPAVEDAGVTPFPGDTSVDVADPVDASGLVVTTVRAARHEGYDRVVFELAGSGTPGWSVEYVDTPSSQGRGEAVHVPGSAFLQVTLQGITNPYESDAQELARGLVTLSGTHVVQGLFYDASFEGTSVAWLGTSERTPFRVYALTGPSRVVVEVADAG
jgi:hypothetical protein